MGSAKTNSRKCAVQALYQWQMTGNDLSQIETNFLEEKRLKTIHKDYFLKIFYGVPKKLNEIDKILAEFIDRPVEAIDPVERAILRIGVYELLNFLDTPYKVIINEGINLAKCYGGEGSYKYVNSILDNVSDKIRNNEIKPK